MLSVRFSGVSFAYDDVSPILDQADLTLLPGFTGVVGENGAGKSTLLALVAGSLRPSAGHVAVLPRGARILLCPQESVSLTPSVAELGAATDARARRLLGQLRLTSDELDRWASLSPGERKRWQIGAALYEEPDVLGLDEPTNHLDREGRQILTTALRDFQGVAILVSHARDLLNELTHTTVRLQRGKLTTFPGPYDAARQAWSQAELGRQALREQQKARLKTASQSLAHTRNEHAGAKKNLSAGKRMKGPKDSDARGIGAAMRAEHAEARLGRRVATANLAVQRAEQAILPYEEGKPLGRSVFVDYEPLPKPLLAHLDQEVLMAGDHPVLNDLRLTLGRDSRVRLSGANGAGKTTLLRALWAAATVDERRLLYLPQELADNERSTLLQQVRTLIPREKGRVLSLLAALGADPEKLLHSPNPSPGEARKLAIAFGLGRHVAGVLLDEPTNHLDLPSVERLEAALAAYPGAIVLVSHDDAFASSITSETWRLERGRLWL